MITGISGMKIRLPFLLAAAALSSCVSVREDHHGTAPAERPTATNEPGTYQVTPGHGSDLVAELRVAPPPQLADVSTGTSIDIDEHKLVAKSYVRIGTGLYSSNDDAARAWALRQAQHVGADKIILYAPSTDAKDNADAPFVAVFYVRYKLPFGAQFRSMTSTQLQALSVDGGVQIGDVVGATPAAEANLRSGDFVLKFNGAPVRDRAAFQELLRANMGKRVTLTVCRDGAQFDRLVRLGILATESHTLQK
jgi:PDZ domain